MNKGEKKEREREPKTKLLALENTVVVTRWEIGGDA